jgi:hypothetical protein
MKKYSTQELIGEAMMGGVYDPFTGKINLEKAKKMAKAKMGGKVGLEVDGKEVSKGDFKDAIDRFKKIGVSASLKQLSKLRNGHKVRLTQGEGCLMVEPGRYDAMSRTFMKGKGMSVQLSPEEIAANRGVMAGEGIFGPGFDRFLKKIGIKKQVYKFGDMIKGPVKKAIKAFADKAPAALGTAGAALATAVGQPQLAPLAIKAGQELGKKARNYSKKHIIGYIDDPESYQKNPKKFGDLKGVGLYASGRGMDRSAVGMADLAAREEQGGYGSGLYAGSSRGGDLSIVGGRQTMMGLSHPALQSQPMGELYHQRFQISPQMLKGAGLYAGGGLYA